MRIAALDRIIAVHDDPDIPDGTWVRSNNVSPADFEGPLLRWRDDEEEAAQPRTDHRCPETQIIVLIDDWDPATALLDQEGFVRRVQCKTGLTFTRQELMKHEPIRLAFVRRLREIGGSATPRADKELLVVTSARHASSCSTASYSTPTRYE